MNYTTDQLQKAFETLPEALQDYIMSADVQDVMTKLIDWFGISDEESESLREGVVAMLVGVANGEEFIKFSQEKLGLALEDAENLFSEIGNRILDQAYIIFDKAVEQAQKDSNQKTNPVASAAPAAKTAPSDGRRFVGVPFYGVEKPASSYTSILPRSSTDVNKMKETPTAESLMKKVGMLAEKPNPIPIKKVLAGEAPAHEPLVPTKNSTVEPSKNLPVIESQMPSIELSKLSMPTNIPRQESRTIQEPQQIQPSIVKIAPSRAPIPPKPISVPPTAPTSSPLVPSAQNTPAPITQIPQASKTYVTGQDPYREAPTA